MQGPSQVIAGCYFVPKQIMPAIIPASIPLSFSSDNLRVNDYLNRNGKIQNKKAHILLYGLFIF
jgi:hypothetical protein